MFAKQEKEYIMNLALVLLLNFACVTHLYVRFFVEHSAAGLDKASSKWELAIYDWRTLNIKPLTFA